MDDASTYRIAVGLDGSAASWKALDEAIALTIQKQALLYMVSIQEETEASYSAAEILDLEKTSREQLERVQLKARMLAETSGIQVSTAIVTGSSANAMVAFVKKNKVDLLVVGDTGHSSLWGALLGNTADKIVRHAPCSVLIVRCREGASGS
ncbi:MAG: universal stress protein [Candidatus Obscuribacterales bacterium]|nr:universal stress protein [Candidatus Obscuribacterales bacterium]